MTVSPPDESPEPPVDRPVPREPAFNIPAVIIALIAVCVGVHLLRFYVLTVDQDFGLLLRTAFIPIRYSGQFDITVYAFTTPLTYAFLHVGLMHLVLNMVWLAAFGPPLANRIGTLPLLLFWCAASVGGAAFFYLFNQLGQAPLVGASGAISGLMGAAARFGFRIDRRRRRAAFEGELLPVAVVLRDRTVVTFLAVWMVVNLVTGVGGFIPGNDNPIAWEAHIGGFLVGFAGIGWFDRRRNGRADPGRPLQA